MKKKKIMMMSLVHKIKICHFKSLSKKFFIKGVATTLVVLLPFSFIKPKEVEAIAVVDDAILVAVLGTLAVGAVGACYAVTNSGLSEKVATTIGDDISEIGNNFATVYNNAKFAKSCIDMLPYYLNAYKSIEGQNYSYSYYSTIENGYSCTYFSKGSIVSISVPNNTQIEIIYNPYGRENITNHTTTSDNFYTLINGDSYRLKSGSNFGSTLCDITESVNYSFYFKYKVVGGITEPSEVSCVSTVPAIDEENINKPTSITLDKAKAEAIASEYVEKYPEDNDDKPDYSNLIPFVFDMLEKELGNGEITPNNLSNNGLVSYYFDDGSTQGQYPYFFEKPVDNNSNGNVIVNNNNNVNIKNGDEVSDDEKNGILNILDNGVRKTTILLSNLKNSMTNLGNTLQGLFDLLPEPVSYLFYSALCLSLIFFILSLRR